MSTPVTRGTGVPYSTYLRNPERNQGMFLGVSRIEQDGDVVRLVGTRRGQDEESVVATGARDPDTGTLSLPLFGSTFDFARETDGSSPFYARDNPPERYRYFPPQHPFLDAAGSTSRGRVSGGSTRSFWRGRSAWTR